MASKWNIRAFDRVVSLRLAGSEFTDEATPDLEALTRLEYLRVTYTRLSDVWLDKFKTTHPNCSVEVLPALNLQTVLAESQN